MPSARSPRRRPKAAPKKRVAPAAPARRGKRAAAPKGTKPRTKASTPRPAARAHAKPRAQPAPAKPRKPARRPAAARQARPGPDRGTVKSSLPAAEADAKASAGAALAAGKLRIAVIGAGGTLGSRIAQEAAARGHAVTPLQRRPGFVKLSGRSVGMRRVDANDGGRVAAAVAGHDAVVCAIAPPQEHPEQLVRGMRGLLSGCRQAGVARVAVVGGAGSLHVGEQRFLDTPEFHAAWRPVAQAHADALAYVRDAATGLQWTVVSPPALIAPGVRTGRYQIGTERLLKGRDGQSRISAEDYAVAVVDELEKGRFKGKRMTVAWP